ncbi:MAG TPA: phenylacetate--CoA ligase family protein [Pirellulales bacterium]
MSTTQEFGRVNSAASRSDIRARQLDRLNQLLARILPHNRFYADKLAEVRAPLASLDDLAKLPFTFKEELQATSHGLHNDNRTHPIEKYVRYHQTSGTRGRPLLVLDSLDDWKWFCECWQAVYDAAQVTSADRLVFAFSFGPFIGFWAAHDAAVDRGCMVAPSGGMSSLARLDLMRTAQATVVLCTPSYALHLVDVAQKHHIRLDDLSVEKIIVAGEPGGSIDSVRAKIERAWGAKVYDHAGATEIGAWGFPDAGRTGLHVNEAEFIPEFLSIERGGAAQPGELAELVLTNLGRVGFPVVRYRTGDLVRPLWPESGGCPYVLLRGGVLGRADDMMIIRGVNIYPTAVEQILRSFPEVHEFRMTAAKFSEMDELTIEIEDQLHQPARVAEELRLRLGLRVEVRCVPLGSLPRFEGKGARFIDHR